MSPRVTWLQKAVRGKRIIDIGFAGVYESSRAHNLIRESNPKSLVVGLDYDFELIKKDKPKTVVVGDGFHLPVKSESVDCVVLAEILEHQFDWISMVNEAIRILEPGGKLIITTPSPYGLLRNLKHWIFSSSLLSKKNVKDYLGAPDHIQFVDPIALMKVCYLNNLKPIELTTKNLGLPYLPENWRNPDFSFWPFNRLGTYSCLIAQKNRS